MAVVPDVYNMKTKKQAWIAALRLQTLPLALGGILLGNFLPEVVEGWKADVFVLTLLTATGLQILSNLANDYGDFVKGTDNENRIGPERALQSGLISREEMKRAMYLCGTLCLLSGLILLWRAFGLEQLPQFLLMLLVGIAAIWAALRYTVGRNPYGYSGWGDLFVLIFFGFVGVSGSQFLQLNEWNMLSAWPALAYGCFSAGVLNINNMRDIENDSHSGKNTLVVKLGAAGARIYHAGLMLTAFLAEGVYLYKGHYSFWTLLAFLPIAVHTFMLLRPKKNPAEYRPFLKTLALGSLLHVLLFVSFLSFF